MRWFQRITKSTGIRKKAKFAVAFKSMLPSSRAPGQLLSGFRETNYNLSRGGLEKS